MKNLDLFIKVADRVLKDEERLFMPNWIGMQPYELGVESKEEAMCNTTACVAGWGCILSGEANLHVTTDHKGVKYAYWESPYDGWERTAINLFGPETDGEEDDLTALFYSSEERALHVLRAVRDEGLTVGEALERSRSVM